MVIPEDHVLPGLEVHDQPFALAVLGNMRDPSGATGLTVGVAARQLNLLPVQPD